MKTSTKNVIITGCFGMATAILGAIGATNMQNNKIEEVINKSEITVVNKDKSLTDTVNNILDKYIDLQKDYDATILNNENLQKEYDDIAKENADLEQNNQELLNEIDQLKSSTVTVESNADNMSNQTSQKIYLKDLSVFNCQYYDRGSWTSTELYGWDEVVDKAADGETHNNVVHMSVPGNYAGYAQKYIIDYLLDGKYKVFNGNFLLDENNKSTTTIATLNIYGDDNKLYQCENITGGFTPQNTGDISVENVTRLRFEFVSIDGELGGYGNHFGVVFYDAFFE